MWLYPKGSILRNFQANFSNVSGISVIVLMMAIKSTIKAPTVSFGGWLSLGCCNGESHFFTISSSSLLFVVARQEPSGFARLRGTEHRGYSSAFSKSITFSFLADYAGKVPTIFLLISTVFVLVFCLI